ncbi:MAG: 23S rRNA (adenine(2503)-C(2))-methyltransferase RlmN [Planctomycetaceae bacterium]|nr:23S rRNA (adenine(2503)-C(2))-methyltransferase RlmN [Planctomycetaceae bacterium]
MNSITSALAGELQTWLKAQNQPIFRYRQIVNWMFAGRASRFADMTNLPQSLRDALARDFSFWSTQISRHTKAADGTEKLLLQFSDTSQIECVLLREGQRRTICISTQVGCAMGCVFCASGLDGVKRNLTMDEIVEQMLRLQRLLPPHERLSHIVVMGMGEPLANLDSLLPALDWAHTDQGLGISARRITISTVGLPKSIDRLAKLAVPYHLAVSLHAPSDTLRNRLVPVNKKIGLHSIMEASDRYFEVSGRRLTFEYVLLAEENDRREQAQQLARLLQGRNALLNVIPYNAVEDLPYRTPSPHAVQQFCKALTSQGIQVQVRQRKGDKINAACGQLRRTAETSPTGPSLGGSPPVVSLERTFSGADQNSKSQE